MRRTGSITSGGIVLDKRWERVSGVTVVGVATATYELCDAYIERAASLDPVMATSRGLVGHDAAMTDYSPDGIAARTELDRSTLRQLEAVRPDDDRDRVAAKVLAER